MIGLPGETWNEILETLAFVERCNPDFVQINIATVFPKTDLYDIALKEKCLPENFSFYDDKTYYGFAVGHIETEEFTPEELMIIRAFEWDRINFTDAEKRKSFVSLRVFRRKAEPNQKRVKKEFRFDLLIP